ncbi:aspartate/glutamate racemase family protein [Ancylobacter sp. 6x-1]|uniref:Aspartate/glutamate racemase family protein n=1 Tax=Ancylobacter crimeensis TaxID=2579147 RepID=A0ABT0DG16_9HYPH|nr:aspartate/glutamate racemase family protein [Ancylobacter crimeensis]MCK0198915.1 aspartate/glutamate racemase family protein [Ancylobacter crimeensis]
MTRSNAALAQPAPTTVDLGVLPSMLGPALGTRAAIGLVVLATEQTMEHEFRHLLARPGVAFYESRLYNDAEITSETLAAIGPRITPATELILPGVALDVVAFGCTSATMTLGEDYVFDAIRTARPEVKCSTPVTAALAAFEALGVRSIGLLTPYSPSITAGLARYFEGRGLTVAASATFDRPDDLEVPLISTASIEEGASCLAKVPGVEAVFISCTSMRVAEVVETIEARTGVPVTSSNHAMAWHCLRLAGVADEVPGAGRLFRTALA